MLMRKKTNHKIRKSRSDNPFTARFIGFERGSEEESVLIVALTTTL